jgi:hypothetical protein
LRALAAAVTSFGASGRLRTRQRSGFDFTRRIWMQQPKKFNTQWNLPRENFAAK